MSDDRPALRAPRVTTTVTFHRDVWLWLREQAAEAALREGGQPSASAVLNRELRSLMQKKAT